MVVRTLQQAAVGMWGRERRDASRRRDRVERELEASRRIMYNIIFYDISFWGAPGYR